MTLRQLITQVRDKLQDTDSVYFSDSELIDIYNECKRYIHAERQEANSTTSISTDAATNVYDIEGVLRFISAKNSDGKVLKLYPNDGTGEEDVDGIIVEDYNRVYVNTPEDGKTVTFRVITLPAEDNLNDEIRIGDENSYKYYMLSKAYEKDTDMEQFQKSQYFANQFLKAVRFNNKTANLGYINTTETTTTYYF